jgi:hypothetical protein
MELAVEGELGPVLRSALLTFAAPHATARTVLRIGASSDVDVLAILEALATEGLDVTSVRRVPRERPRGVRASG